MIAQLIDVHPALFRGKVPPCSELPEGWYPMADALCTAIESSMSPDQLKAFHIRQITQKAGMLRIYPAGISTTGIEYLINAVAEMSALTCMDCGSPGHLRKGGQDVTLCDFCEEERQIRINRRSQTRSAG
jgi:hypothetical protein